MELDPTAADIPAELAALYLRQNKVHEAMAAAEQALKIAPANREANRVLGIIYAALSEGADDGARAAARAAAAHQARRQPRQGDHSPRDRDRPIRTASRSERARDARAPLRAEPAPTTRRFRC